MYSGFRTLYAMKSYRNTCWLLGILALLAQTAPAQVDPTRIDIARDRWGVPHIFAKTDAEVAYGLAWAHAEDDFKTTQLTLLGAKGMLGKHLGKSGAAVDYVVGLIRAREQAQRDYPAKFSADYRAVMSGYVQGINAYATAHPNEVLVRGSFPVSEIDLIVGFILSNASFSGIDRALTSILGGTMPRAPKTAVSQAKKPQSETHSFAGTPARSSLFHSFAPGGSNGIALNSKRTADGQTYLAINSHQPLEGPVAWYEAHLCSEEGWNILGGLFPGAATILHGVNENLGWAHTVNYHDKMDVYELTMNPATKNEYWYDGKWVPLEARSVKLRVKGIPIAINKKAYWSEYGPAVVTKKGAFAMRYAGLFETRTGEQWYRMNKACTYAEFYKALQMTAIPMGFNIIYADRNDTIMYLTNGKIPRRDPGYDWQQTLPGNTSKTRWTQFHPIEGMPQVVNPNSGYVFNSNNTPFHCTDPAESPKPEAYDPTMGIERFELNRSVRMGEMMAGSKLLSYEEFKRVKYDLQLPGKLTYRTDINPLFALKPADYPDVASLIETLNNWDRRADTTSHGAAVFAVTYMHIKDILQKEGGSPYRPLTPAECVQGLQLTKTYLTTHFGTTDLPLGRLQRHTRGTVSLPCPGIPDVLAAMDSKPTKTGELRANQGESYIELVRFRKDALPEIETVNAYGASNHADSPHYTDQMGMFVNQQTKKMTLDKKQVLQEAKRVYHPVP